MKISRYKLETILADKHLQLQDVPKLAKISSATLSLAINGKRDSTCKTIGKIAEALKVSAKDITID